MFKSGIKRANKRGLDHTRSHTPIIRPFHNQAAFLDKLATNLHLTSFHSPPGTALNKQHTVWAY